AVGKRVGARPVGADEVALDDIVGTALKPNATAISRNEVARRGVGAADPIEGRSIAAIEINADTDGIRLGAVAGGVDAQETAFDNVVARLNNPNAAAPSMVNHQPANGAAAAAQENQAGVAGAADFDQQCAAERV